MSDKRLSISFGIRVPLPLYEMLKRNAMKNYRSLSAEVLMRLEASFRTREKDKDSQDEA